MVAAMDADIHAGTDAAHMHTDADTGIGRRGAEQGEREHRSDQCFHWEFLFEAARGNIPRQAMSGKRGRHGFGSEGHQLTDCRGDLYNRAQAMKRRR